VRAINIEHCNLRGWSGLVGLGWWKDDHDTVPGTGTMLSYNAHAFDWSRVIFE